MHVGDEPSQRRHCGLLEGNARHFCTLCTYAPGQSYNASKHKMRDYEETTKLWDKVSQGGTEESQAARLTLQQLSISSTRSALVGAYMGVGNNIFKGQWKIKQKDLLMR